MRYATIAAFAACIGLAFFGGTALAGDDNDGDRHERADQSIQLGCPAVLPGAGHGPRAAQVAAAQVPERPVPPHRLSRSRIAARRCSFPSTRKESYEAGARMGAGIVECDVTFTKDGQLVCRHDECDLHTTTNIVEHRAQRELHRAVVRREFRPALLRQRHHAGAVQDAQGQDGCVESRRDHRRGLSRRHGDLAHGSLHRRAARCSRCKESIALNKRLGVKHTPELKAGNPARVNQVFGSQANYAQAMINEFKRAGVKPRDVFAQSFNLADVTYWVTHEPAFGKQAVYLDDVDPGAGIPPLTAAELRAVRAQGVRIFAPPIPALLAVDASNDTLVPSQYAQDIKAAGLGIITWSFERSDLRRGAAFGGFYAAYDPEGRVVKKDSDMYLRARRARAGRRRHGRLLRLARDRELLRELHGSRMIRD